MENTIEKLKDQILDYTDEYNQITADINNIERQLKLYEQGNLEMRPGTWYMKARKAFNIKKNQRLETSKVISRLQMEFKTALAETHNRRKEEECHLYYIKLENMLSAEDFKTYMDGVKEILDKSSGVPVEEPAEVENGEDI